jgi:hypothetical protein
MIAASFVDSTGQSGAPYGLRPGGLCRPADDLRRDAHHIRLSTCTCRWAGSLWSRSTIGPGFRWWLTLALNATA